MEELFKQLLIGIGEDVNREGLLDTPKRAAEALRYLTRGYKENINETINNALFASEMNELVIIKDIELYSMCEHHLLPFIGKCHIGYLPNGKVLGLSKFARITDHFASRLQIQERLTSEIAEVILTTTQARGVGVVIEAKHLCMMMRGVQKQNSIMTTSVMLGDLRDNLGTRSEFLKLIDR